MTGEVFRALADPTRRDLLDALRAGPATTGSLATAFSTTRFAVMKHLQVLVDAGLVTVERRGRERWNHLDPVPLRRIYERWLAPYAEGLAVTALALQRAAEASTREQPMTSSQTTERPAPPTRDLAAGRIDVRTEQDVAAPATAVWAALLDLGSWWPHRFRDGARVTLDPEVGGRIVEHWPDGGGSLYGTIRRLDPGRGLTVDGPMGVRGPVAAVWSLDLVETAAGCRLTLSHQAFGDIDPESQRSYAEGWTEVLGALAAHALAR